MKRLTNNHVFILAFSLIIVWFSVQCPDSVHMDFENPFFIVSLQGKYIHANRIKCSCYGKVKCPNSKHFSLFLCTKIINFYVIVDVIVNRIKCSCYERLEVVQTPSIHPILRWLKSNATRTTRSCKCQNWGGCSLK